MVKKIIDDDEQRPGWFWKFVRGVLIATMVSAAAIAALSIYVLPPPQLPPEPEVAEQPAEPEMIGGIEVSKEPAYTNPAASGEAASESGTTEANTNEAATTQTGTPETGTTATPEMGTTASGTTEQTADQTGTLEPVVLSGPALTVNSEPFDATDDLPLVAVILVDTAANPLLHEVLFAVKLPLTIGVVAGSGGDRETATAARAAGFEVVVELPVAAQGGSDGAALEFGMAEEEAATRTLTMMQRLPMAVAALRGQAVPPLDYTVLRGILGALTPLGFGYVDHGVAPGSSSPAKAARQDAFVGVSSFRIPTGASAAEVISALDLAAADAVKKGGAVVLTAPDEQVILALQLWGEGGVGNLARVGPLSAVIRRQNGG
jgi:polysaccharide deacetylase 2 family uncharacterized protein YibQ